MIELKRLEADLARIKSARLDLEVRIEERLLEIENIKKHIQIQEAKEMELNNNIVKLKEGK